MLKTLARAGLEFADNVCAAFAPRTQHASGTLVTVLFHSLLPEPGLRGHPHLAPCQDITVDEFRRFVAAVLESGYQPVSPVQIDAGLPPGGKYVMITFDDGYHNNTLALDVLERFHAPATFFISTDHVLQRKGFWWDAFNRELERAGVDARQRKAEIHRAKALPAERIEAMLHERFGAGVLRPRGDLDRPFDAAELKDFSRSKWVHLGNHTCAHAILTNCSTEESARQIVDCQQALAAISGHTPIAIAYPNGDYSRSAVDAARQAGLRVGVTVRPFSNRLPLDTPQNRMTLGRFMPSGGRDMAAQWRKFSAGFIPSHMLKTLMSSAF